MKRLKSIVRIVRDGRPWRPGHLRYLLRQVYHRRRNEEQGYSDRDHLLAAVRWLEAAQDVGGDGGVCGRYSLSNGWSSSYPETTGYILPTFLTLADELGQERYRERARRCLEFLLPLQLESGAFPGLEVADNSTDPSPFNTAQILHGLVAWHRDSGEDRALEAACRAGDWLLSVQDQDGAFRRHFYQDVATTYSAHASCWLAELGDHIGNARYLEAARRHLDWTLTHQHPETGWFELSGFTAEDHDQRTAFTHTIAYTLWGVLATSEIVGREDGIDAVHKAAEAIARRLELSRRLPGVLDHQWKPRADYICLTGNAQMALVWMRLHERGEPNLRLLNAALKALDAVKCAQHMNSPHRALRGGVAGSDPVWGGYIYNAVPNWSAKYFIDAMLEKKRLLTRLEEAPVRGNWTVPADVSRELPEPSGTSAKGELKVVLYTSPQSKKPAQMLDAWSAWGFRPHAFVIEQKPGKSVFQRLRRRLRESGLAPLLLRLMPGRRPGDGSAGPGPSLANPADLAREMDIPVIHVPPLSTPDAVEAVRSLAPDVAVQAGVGILRVPLLELPRFGTLNAHMGVLPYYRGMNVTEWAALVGDPVGCSVHLIDPGIDTGDILCVRLVDPSPADTVSGLRARVDEAQIELLGDAVRYVMNAGKLPPRRSQMADEGVQFFRMHQDLRALLERELRNAEK